MARISLIDVHRIKNELIDRNLKLLAESNSRFFRNQIENIDGNRLHLHGDEVVKFLVEANLAEVEPVHEERLDITQSGMSIYLEGGWLKHLSKGKDTVDSLSVDNPIWSVAHIHVEWKKVFERLSHDYSGAITSARTLIETTLKFILDERQIEYKDSADLPDLYKHCATILNLAPNSSQEQMFRQILSGTQNVITGVGAVRSKVGDAHGIPIKANSADYRHAEFMANLSGATAIFLLRTHEEVK